MENSHAKFTRLYIKNDNKDAIRVYIEDNYNELTKSNCARVTIQSFNQAWTGYWGSIGKKNAKEFFVKCSDEYLIGSMLPFERRESFSVVESTKDLKKSIAGIRQDDTDYEYESDLDSLERELAGVSSEEEFKNLFLTHPTELFGLHCHNHIVMEDSTETRWLKDILVDVREQFSKDLSEKVS